MYLVEVDIPDDTLFFSVFRSNAFVQSRRWRCVKRLGGLTEDDWSTSA